MRSNSLLGSYVINLCKTISLLRMGKKETRNYTGTPHRFSGLVLPPVSVSLVYNFPYYPHTPPWSSSPPLSQKKLQPSVDGIDPAVIAFFLLLYCPNLNSLIHHPLHSAWSGR